MQTFMIVPTIYEYKDFKAFAEEFCMDRNDLIITNSYILNDSRDCGGCQMIFQEQYGTGEPTDIMINRILNDLSCTEYNRIFAIGGGTVLDIAKIIAVSEENTNVNKLYENADKLKKIHKLFLLPTTCGTGSEMTNIAVVNRTECNTKQGRVSRCMFAVGAVLVPQFIDTLPYAVFATSSLDALVHAVESYLSPKATDFSRMYSSEAIKLILSGYKIIVEERKSIAGLGKQFLRASSYAGVAFGNAGCGTVHAMSYAFGGKYHVSHGEANYQFFMEILKYYKNKGVSGGMSSLMELFSKCLGLKHTEDALERLDRLLNDILPRRAMKEYGAVEEDVLEFAESTMVNQQRLLKNSYVPMTKECLAEIYRKCLY